MNVVNFMLEDAECLIFVYKMQTTRHEVNNQTHGPRVGPVLALCWPCVGLVLASVGSKAVKEYLRVKI